MERLKSEKQDVLVGQYPACQAWLKAGVCVNKAWPLLSKASCLHMPASHVTTVVLRQSMEVPTA